MTFDYLRGEFMDHILAKIGHSIMYFGDPLVGLHAVFGTWLFTAQATFELRQLVLGLAVICLDIALTPIRQSGKSLQSKINSDGSVSIGLRLIHNIHRDGNEPATAVFLNPTRHDLAFKSQRFGHVCHFKFRNVDLMAIGVELVIGKATPRSFFPGLALSESSSGYETQDGRQPSEPIINQ
jgi:hypothetical protein